MSVTTPNLAAARAQDNLMASLRTKPQDAATSMGQTARGLDQAVQNLSVLIRQNCLTMPSLG
jgi:hypothetical protein